MRRRLSGSALIACVAAMAGLGLTSAAAAPAAGGAPTPSAITIAFQAGFPTGQTALYLTPARNTSGARIVLSRASAVNPPGAVYAWLAQVHSNGSVSLRIYRHQSLCLEVPGSRYTAGTALVVAGCNGRANQEFILPGDDSANGGGLFTVRPYPADQQCLRVAGGFSVGHVVALGSCGRSLNGAWSTLLGTEVLSSRVVGAARRGTAAPRFSDVFTNGNSGANAAPAPLLLTAGRIASGARIFINRAGAGLTSVLVRSRWEVVGNSNATITVQLAVDRNLCLQVPSSRYRSGIVLGLGRCDGAANQQFLLEFNPVRLYPNLAPNRFGDALITPYRADSLSLNSGNGSAGSLVVERPAQTVLPSLWVLTGV
jgi:hypothetical protein